MITDAMNSKYKIKTIMLPAKGEVKKVKKSKVKLVATLLVLMTVSGLLGLIYEQVYGGNFYEQHKIIR